MEMSAPSEKTVPMRIVVLEDDRERRETFRELLTERFAQFELRFAETSGDCIRLIDEAFHHIALVALDNDLELLKTSAGVSLDAGSGLEVLEYLLRREPAFPVLVHTTNTAAGDSIEERLEAAHWKVARVVPYGDLEWIRQAWFPLARHLIVEHVPRDEDDEPLTADRVLAETVDRLHQYLESPGVSGLDRRIVSDALSALESRREALARTNPPVDTGLSPSRSS